MFFATVLTLGNLGIARSICDGFDITKLDGSNEGDYCAYKVKNGYPLNPGDVCMAHPEDLKPTQGAFGEVDAYCTQLKLESLAGKHSGNLKKYLAHHIAPAVLGPGNLFYITDHHHLSHALLRSFLPYGEPKKHRAMYVCITEDMSNKTVDDFWGTMQSKQLVRLSDEQGLSITHDQLPKSVKYLRDDPYRTLAQWARESYAFVKCGKKSVDKTFPQCEGGIAAKPFIEFRWADLYRTKFPVDNIYIESDQAQVKALSSQFKEVIEFSLGRGNKDLEGWNQKQYTEMVSLDSHGCIADSLQPSVVV